VNSGFEECFDWSMAVHAVKGYWTVSIFGQTLKC